MSKTVFGTPLVVRWGCNMGIPIGGSTGQLLCVGMDGADALYGGSKKVKNGFWDALDSALYGCEKRWLPINVKNHF
jgi:hypothetical protein